MSEGPFAPPKAVATSIILLEPSDYARLTPARRAFFAKIARLPLDRVDALVKLGLPVTIDRATDSDAALRRAACLREMSGLPMTFYSANPTSIVWIPIIAAAGGASALGIPLVESAASGHWHVAAPFICIGLAVAAIELVRRSRTYAAQFGTADSVAGPRDPSPVDVDAAVAELDANGLQFDAVAVLIRAADQCEIGSDRWKALVGRVAEIWSAAGRPDPAQRCRALVARGGPP